MLDKLKNILHSNKQSIQGNNNIQVGKNYININNDDIPAQIDHSKSLLDNFKPESALEFLEKLKERVWNKGSVTNIDKFRILNNMGSAKMMMVRYEEASSHFIEAFNFNKEDERALSNIAMAYSIKGESERSADYAKEVIKINPEHIYAYCILIQNENKNLRELETIIPPKLKDKSDILASLGYKALSQKAYIESTQYFEKAIANDVEDNADYKATLASVKLEMITNQYLNLPGLNKKECATESLTLLNSLIDKYQNTELIKYKSQWYLLRGVAKKLVGDIKGAKEDLLRALEYKPDDVIVKRDLALLEFESNESEKGILLLEEIKNNIEIPEVKILLADMYRINKKYKEAEDTILEFIKSNSDRNFVENADRVLEHVYLAKKDFESAEIINKRRKESNSNNILALIDETSVYSSVDTVRVKAKLKEAVLKIDSNTNPYEKKVLANRCYDLQLYVEAMNLYEMFVNSDEDSQESRRLLNCYFKNEKFEKALKLCKTLRRINKEDVSLIDMQTFILEEIGNFEEAKIIYEEALNMVNHPSLIIDYANLCLRNNDINKLKELLRKDIDPDVLKMEDRIALAYLYSNNDFNDRFYELMYETRRKFFNDSAVHSSYAGLFLMGGEKNSKLINLEKVTNNSVVFLKRNDEQKYYILDNREDADLCKQEINDKSSIYNKLIGKKKNDKINLLENDYIKESWEIIEIKSKYIHALHTSMDLINENFPEEKSFQKISIDTQKNSAESLQEILDLMFKDEDKRRKNIEIVLKNYKEGKLTIGMIAKFFDKNPIEVWSNFVADTQIGVINNSGSKSDYDLTHLNFIPENGLAIDVIALCTLVNINIIDSFVKVFGKFKITQSTVDVITNLKSELQGIRSKGYMSLGKKEGEYIRIEVTKENIASSISFLEQAMNIINSYCEILPINPKTIEDFSEYGKYKDLLGKSFIDTVLMSKQENTHIYTDDNNLRGFIFSQFQKTSAWTQFILQYLLTVNAITLQEYNSCVLKLSDLNYYHTSIDSKVLIEKGKQINWIPDYSFINILKILGGNFSDEFPSVIVSANFIFELWNQIVSNEKRNIVLDLLLSNLVKDRYNKNVLLKLKLVLQVKFHLLPIQLDEILSLISIWEERNIT
jgi:tetratricopeptide (TPR) repeat protein